MTRPCGNADCSISTGICESLTFVRGELDHNGYWEIPCAACARDYERRYPEAECWPPAGEVKP
jgi:hypothetical protein